MSYYQNTGRKHELLSEQYKYYTGTKLASTETISVYSSGGNYVPLPQLNIYYHWNKYMYLNIGMYTYIVHILGYKMNVFLFLTPLPQLITFIQTLGY